jgi:hypothetical protein
MFYVKNAFLSPVPIEYMYAYIQLHINFLCIADMSRLNLLQQCSYV